MASSDLIWGVVRNQSSFLIKRNGTQFTSEPNNLTAVNSFKYSGLANAKAVGIEITSDKAATLTVKTVAAGSKPSKATRKINLKAARGPKVINKVIDGSIDKTFYRRDLSKAALARYSAVHRALRNKANGVTYKPKAGRSRR